MMKRFLCITLFLCIIFPVSAGAQFYNFIGSDAGGTGSATMGIDIVDTTATVTLINTSPILLDDSSGPNAPGIVGFGFNLLNDHPLPVLFLESWVLSAFEAGNIGGNIGTDDTPIGSRGGDYSSEGVWEQHTTLAGVNLDYLFRLEGSGEGGGGGVDGALFNPDAVNSTVLPSGSNDNYFTTATLVLNFDEEPIFAEDFENFSPFVRMQNVGLNGEGSLKLTVVPEPSTMIISSLFLLGAGVFVRRKLHPKS